MHIPLETTEHLHEIKKNEVSILLLAMKECEKKDFNIEGCHIDMTLTDELATNKKTYIVSFYPREVTPENAMEYELLLDDLNVYIDADTRTVINSSPSI